MGQRRAGGSGDCLLSGLAGAVPGCRARGRGAARGLRRLAAADGGAGREGTAVPPGGAPRPACGWERLWRGPLPCRPGAGRRPAGGVGLCPPQPLYLGLALPALRLALWDSPLGVREGPCPLFWASPSGFYRYAQFQACGIIAVVRGGSRLCAHQKGLGELCGVCDLALVGVMEMAEVFSARGC